ncbi:MAG: TonB family protein [Bacteroidales bacterium]
MEAFGLYMLKSAIWLTGFAVVYFLFLQNERFFRLKRYYLVAGMLASVLLPLVTIRYNVEVPVPQVAQGSIDQAVPAGISPAAAGQAFDFWYFLLFLYLTGLAFFTFRFINHIVHLTAAITRTRANTDQLKLIRAPEFSGSFSFFRYVFINPSVSETELKIIMSHEEVHVSQKHWVDLLLVELLRLIQWANPFVWIYTGFVRQNHEYIADEVALQRTSDPAVYKAVLVNQLFGSTVFSLTDTFNFSLNKKRFEMMKKIVSSPYRKLKMLFVLPLFAIVLYAFAEPEYIYNQPPSETQELKEVTGVVLGDNGKPIGGVTIVVLNTSIQAMTDANGRFELNIPPEDSLMFSRTGCSSLTIRPDFSNEMTVRMETPYVVVEEMPSYPGGEKALLKFIQENTRYPEEAKAKGVKGKVIIRFIVTTHGNAEGISVLKGVDPALDAEAIRVVSLLKGFKPGMQGGKPVDVWYSVTVDFALPKAEQ